MEETLNIAIGSLLDQVIKRGSRMSQVEAIRVENVLHDNQYVFTWTVIYMLEIAPLIMCHKFNVDPNYRSVRQKKRKMALERISTAREEVAKLLKAGFIR